MFLESYSLHDDYLEINKSKDKIEEIEKLVEYIENNSPPLKYAFEIIPFRKNGYLRQK